MRSFFVVLVLVVASAAAAAGGPVPYQVNGESFTGD